MFAVDGEVTHIRFYATSTVSGNYVGELWQQTADDVPDGAGAGTLLGSTSTTASGSITAGTWNTIAFSSPIAVSTGVIYRATIHSSAGRYVATTNFFNSSGLTNGNLTAPQSGTTPDPPNIGLIKNGSFRLDSAAGNYPKDVGGPTCYFADVVFQTTGGSEIAVTAAADLGALAGTATVTRETTLTGTAALGGLTASAVVTVTPPNTTTRGGGWYSLLDIVREAHATRDQAVAAPPAACPNDGEPLRAAPDGGLYCPFDGWRPR